MNKVFQEQGKRNILQTFLKENYHCLYQQEQSQIHIGRTGTTFKFNILWQKNVIYEPGHFKSCIFFLAGPAKLLSLAWLCQVAPWC